MSEQSLGVDAKRRGAARRRGGAAAGGLLAVWLALSGCSGSLFQSKVAPPTIYLLVPTYSTPARTPAAAPGDASAAAPADAPRPIPLDLAVLRPRVRAGLESERIAVVYPDHRLDYFADARWSGPLAEVLQDAVVQAMHSRAHLRGVSGDASVFASAYWLEIEVTDFQAEYPAGADSPTAHVRLLARVGRSGDRSILGRFTVEGRAEAASNRLGTIVAAFAQASGTALGDAAAQAEEILAQAKNSP
ncbi:MAG TPA: ABC-type transport auxiliary lipoprotein family protein [Steroidobacteraceae bacterium]|nr:ABC-type transport auxiliary lipoprotein family protein [Steroidobacteraceae bacterium]